MNFTPLFSFSMVLALGLAGCAPGEMKRSRGNDLVAEGKYAEGISQLAEATRDDPTNASLRKDFLLQRQAVIERLMTEAGMQRKATDLNAAELTYRRILGIDPDNAAARQGIDEIEVDRRHDKMLKEAAALAKKGDTSGAKSTLRVVDLEAPGNPDSAKLRKQMDDPTIKERIAGPTLNVKGRKPLTLQFRDANLKMVLEAIARTTGINILIDKEVRNDNKVTIFVKDTPVEEAIDFLMFQNQLERRVLGENTVMIYPATPAKNKDYQELKIRRFSLGSADPKQVQAMLKTIVKTKDIFVDEKTSSVVIRDAPEAIRIAERLVEAMDQPEPEVMLEIDIMQVDRDRRMSLGIDWTRSATWSLRKDMTLEQFKSRTSADINFPSPVSITAKAEKVDGDVNDLAKPRIRVRNKEKAKILIGTRNPVVSSAATPMTGGASPVYNTAVQYIETGIKLEVEPQIHPDGDVAIKLALEVSAAGAQIDIPGSTGTLVFPVTTNNVNTLLQMRDGETQIIGGLIQHQNDQSQSKIPGLGDVPVVGRLFGSVTDTWNKKELVMAITPHVVRNVQIRDVDLVELWSGTEAKVRFGSPNLGVSGGSGVATSQPAAPTVPAVPVIPSAPSTSGVPVRTPPVASNQGRPPPSQNSPTETTRTPATPPTEDSGNRQ